MLGEVQHDIGGDIARGSAVERHPLGDARKRGGRAYSIADEGLHIVIFLIDGNVVYRIRIDARPGGANPTTLAVNLPQFGKRRR